MGTDEPTSNAQLWCRIESCEFYLAVCTDVWHARSARCDSLPHLLNHFLRRRLILVLVLQQLDLWPESQGWTSKLERQMCCQKLILGIGLLMTQRHDFSNAMRLLCCSPFQNLGF